MAGRLFNPRRDLQSSNSNTGPSIFINKLVPTKFVRCIVKLLDDSQFEVEIEVCCIRFVFYL